jgi:hypothetical protein
LTSVKPGRVAGRNVAAEPSNVSSEPPSTDARQPGGQRDHQADRIRAPERALRSLQDLDPLDVGQIEMARS